jgi:uncharacterized membrane protein YdjX (TVP38/TMEM64 family)
MSTVGEARRWAEGGSLRRFAPFALLAAGLALAVVLDLDRFLALDALREHRQQLLDLVASHAVVAALTFMAVYVAAVALSVPGASFLTIAGGFLFGWAAASAMVVVAATAGATLLFLAARSAFGGVLARRAGPAVARFEAGFRKDAFSYLLSLRLLPIAPFWLVNLVPALLGVRLSTFVLSTFIGIIPGTIVYASLGSGLGATLAAGADPDLAVALQPEILLPLLGLCILALLPAVIRRVKARRGRPDADDRR